MKLPYLAPFAVAALAGCGDSTSPANLSADPILSNLGTMNVGDVRVLTFAQGQNGLTIPSAEAQGVYLVVTANAAGDTGNVPQFTVRGDHFGATQPSVAANTLPSLPFRPLYTRVGGPRGAQFEGQLRTYERTHLSPLRTLGQKPGATSPRLRNDLSLPVGSLPTVGSVYQFHVPGSGSDPCDTFSTVSAQVVKISNRAIIAVDTRALNNGFTQTDYNSLANEFDGYIYPTDSGYFGNPTDIDNNGHIYILYTPAVNLLTPANSQSFVGGFTFAGDFIPPNQGCLESNQAEIFYLMVPDASGQYGNQFPIDFVHQQTRVTMAHEFQHAINAGNRLVNTGAPIETAWLDESLSSIGEDAVGRAELGLPDLQTITLSAIAHFDTSIVNTFFLTNFGRTQVYAQRPDTVGAVVSELREEQDVAAFGAGWAFLRYVDDWYSPASNPRTLTAQLVAGPDTGIKNLTLHAGATLDTLLAHWLITMYTDSRPIAGLPARYNYRSYNLRDIVQNGGICVTTCDSTWLPIHQIGNGTTTLPLGIPSTSANYFVTTQTTGGARTIRVTNAGGTTKATYPYGRIYVVRLE